MFNINKINTVYLACGVTDLRKSIDGLVMIVQNEMKLDPFDNVLFVFCNKQMNKLKILQNARNPLETEGFYDIIEIVK